MDRRDAIKSLLAAPLVGGLPAATQVVENPRGLSPAEINGLVDAKFDLLKAKIDLLKDKMVANLLRYNRDSMQRFADQYAVNLWTDFKKPL